MEELDSSFRVQRRDTKERGMNDGRNEADLLLEEQARMEIGGYKDTTTHCLAGHSLRLAQEQNVQPPLP